MCTTASRALAALSLAAVYALSGCIDADGDADIGTVNINLVGQGSSGVVYRLRDATFTVDGPAAAVWHTEDDPDRTTLSADVPVGSYSALLVTGWRLERLTPGMPAVTVNATLTSANPLTFGVVAGARTAVPFRFAVDGDVVDLTQGYDITIGVDDLGTNIVLSTAMVNLVEGATFNINVRLATAPAAPVTVAVTSSDPSAVAVMPASFTFTSANYNVPQTLTSAAVHDADTSPETVTLSLSAMGLPAATVAVVVNDLDVQTIQLGIASLTVVEGNSAAVTVRLAAAPAANVVVQVASSDTSALAVAPASLVFTAANYNVPQVVAVTAVADADVVGEAVTVALSSAGIPTATVAVVIADDDVQAIATTVSALSVVEGGTAAFGLRLAFQPASPVTLQIVSSDPSAATVTPASITFTPASWATNQIINVLAPQDADTLNELVTVHVTSPGVTAAAITVDVLDNDL